MKRKILIFIVILIFVIGIGVGGYFYYDKIYLDKVSDIELKLNGGDVILNLEEEYKEEGCSANFRDEDISNLIEVNGNIDTTKVGSYEIIYRINYKEKYKEVKRIVKVNDNIAPEIKLNGKSDITVYLNEKYKENGASAIDNYDGDISDKIEISGEVDNSKEGVYELVYKVVDSSGNSSEVKRNITVKKKPLVHKSGVAVLNYHFFYEKEGSCNQINCLSIYKFEEQIKYLKENNYKILTMEEFKAYMYGQLNIPEKAVLITIDDGAAGTGKHNGNLLIPMLEKYQVPATLFLITGWWNIENYRSSYLTIESHSNDMHTEKYCDGVSRGAKMLCLSYEEVVEDLRKSVAITLSTDAFCYPFYVYNEDSIRALQEVGFSLAFAGGNYKATRNSNKYAIPRFQIKNNITMDDFIYMVY